MRRSLPGLGGIILLGTLSACGGAGSDGGSVEQGPVGVTASKPGATPQIDGDDFYVVDANQSGEAPALVLESTYWGRLVDMLDEQGRLVFSDIVIGPNVGLESEEDLVFAGWEALETNSVTGSQTLRIKADVLTERALFDEYRAAAEAAVQPVEPTGTAATETPPFPTVGRNAAVVLVFNDLLQESTIGSTVAGETSVQVLVGTPAVTPFDARVLPDANHGGIGADGSFHTSRVIVDFTIDDGEVDTIPQVVEVNEVGLPASSSSTTTNVALRMPSREAAVFGIVQVLSNLKGKTLDPFDNEKTDFGSVSVDVVRAFRAGNDLDTDLEVGIVRGFLRDEDPPEILGVQPVTILSATADPAGGPRDFIVSYSYTTTDCAQDPAEADVLELSKELRLEVRSTAVTASGGDIEDVPVRVPLDDDVDDFLALLGADPAIPNEAGELIDGQVVPYLTPWRNELGAALAPCFVRFSPTPGTGQADDVAPDAEIVVQFSEPIRPETVRPVDTFVVGRVAGLDTLTNDSPGLPGSEAPQINELILGRILSSSDARAFRFVPSLPLTHAAGEEEEYYLSIVSTLGTGLTDLSGNSLTEEFPEVPFRLDADAAPQNTGGWVLRFNSSDEVIADDPDSLPPNPPPGGGGVDPADGPFDPDNTDASPDLAGQYILDLNLGRIIPRPVQRFGLVIDRTQDVVAPMTPVGGIPPGSLNIGTAEPLISAGSRTQHMWRYVDAGLEVNQTDGTFYNLDIEGLSLAPITGSVASSIFGDFAMAVGHAKNLYDELFDPINQVPIFPTSGLRNGDSFVDNYLDAEFAVVHEKDSGFVVSPADERVSSTGLKLAPMPWNLNVPDSEKRYWTWRDTAIQTLGSLNEAGDLLHWGAPVTNEVAFANLDPIYVPLTGVPLRLVGDVYGFEVEGAAEGRAAEGIPTGGLPILVEYRCFPTEQSSLNLFDASVHVPAGLAPFSRAHSTGGTNLSGNLIQKDPDQQPDPTGGFAPQATPTNPPTPPLIPPGTPTVPRDPFVYMGQLDAVLRVSRATTVLIDCENQPKTGINAIFPGTTAANFEPDYTSIFVEPLATEQPGGTAVTFAFRGDDRNLIGGTRDFILDGAKLDLYGDVAPGQVEIIDTDMDGFPDAANATTAELFAFDEGNGGGEDGFSTFVDSVDGVDGLRFVQTRITFISNPSTGLSPSLSAFGLTFRR